MNLGRAIKLCRNQRGHSQATLAGMAKISVSYLSLLERNERDPSLSTVQTIANALGVPLSIIAFLGADIGELKGLPDDLHKNLAATALLVIHDK